MWVERRPAEEDLRARAGLIEGEKVREIWGGQMVQGFVGEDQEFVVDPM